MGLLLGAGIWPGFSQTHAWQDSLDRITAELASLELPPLRIAYLDNFHAIRDQASVEEQSRVFDAVENLLQQFDPQSLSQSQKLEYELLDYLLQLNRERILLEKQWLADPPETIPQYGLAHLPNARPWYRYFLKRWIDLSVEPDSLYAFGLQEIDRVKSEMRVLQEEIGMAPASFQRHLDGSEFLYQEAEQVQSAFEQYAAEVRLLLPTYFPHMDRIPKAEIRRNTDPDLNQVPGYYRNNTFYYCLSDKPFNKRQVAFLFLHEAEPGHHYQLQIDRSRQLSPLQSLFWVPAYGEGWAAYVEDVGIEIGAYPTEYDEWGKWEWDLIRSVRVPLDVGLNYYGWSAEKALDFWREHIQGQDDIGRREIARMLRWPCQVITYKFGARRIWAWKEKLEERRNFSLKDFHQKILENGPLPFSVMESRVMRNPG